jgi:predicted nucleotidyltransferase
MQKLNPHLIVPLGTKVVVRAEVRNSEGQLLHPKDALGMIVAMATDGTLTYRVQFPDGVEVTLNRQEFSIRAHYQLEGIAAALPECDFYANVIYRCIVGSRAYGLSHDASDTDYRGIFLPPAEAHWSLTGVPEQLENPQTADTYWELQKFLLLALKANPNILECLYTPLVELATPLAQELLALRECFLSKLIYQTYNGYVLSQFKKLERDLRTQGEIKWKHAMHLVRLLISGVTALKEGYIMVQQDGYRDALLSIRHEEMSWDEVETWRLALHAEFDAAYASTRLPERPDYARVNAFLLQARRSMV